MKINKFLLGFGLGGLLASYICEKCILKFSDSERDMYDKVINMQSGVIDTFYSELVKAYKEIERLKVKA